MTALQVQRRGYRHRKRTRVPHESRIAVQGTRVELDLCTVQSLVDDESVAGVGLRARLDVPQEVHARGLAVVELLQGELVARRGSDLAHGGETGFAAEQTTRGHLREHAVLEVGRGRANRGQLVLVAEGRVGEPVGELLEGAVAIEGVVREGESLEAKPGHGHVAGDHGDVVVVEAEVLEVHQGQSEVGREGAEEVVGEVEGGELLQVRERRGRDGDDAVVGEVQARQGG